MANHWDDCEACLAQPVTAEMAAFLAIDNKIGKTVEDSYEWLRTLVAVPCNQCYNTYMDPEFTGEIFQEFISLNDTQKIDMVCGGPRGYSDPQSNLLFYISMNALYPLNLNVLKHIRGRWRSDYRMDEVIDYHNTMKSDELVKDDYDLDNQVLPILNSCVQ